jgi:SepF-like predicted cell division protein (DUF552 family)
MEDIPKLRSAAIPKQLLRSEYFWHIHETVAFEPQDQRVVPAAVRARIRSIGNEGVMIDGSLDILSAFLAHTFVFDNMDATAREAMRAKLAREDPEGHAWYENNLLRMNKIASLMSAILLLEQCVGSTLRRTMDIVVVDKVEDMNQEVTARWKKVVAIISDLSPLEHNYLKKNFVARQLAPLVQDVFDATILIFNDFQIIATTPGGTISRTMREIYDTHIAIRAGMRGTGSQDSE